MLTALRAGSTYVQGVVSTILFTILFRDFYKQALLWSTLSHPNLLELVGFQEDTKKQQFIAVTEWMEHRIIKGFVGKNHTANRYYATPLFDEDLTWVPLRFTASSSFQILIVKHPCVRRQSPRVCIVNLDFLAMFVGPNKTSSENECHDAREMEICYNQATT